MISISAKAGALPCSLLAAIGDFFSPIGFWLLPLVSGIAGLVLTLTFAVSDTWRNRALSAFFGPERARLWEKPFGKSAALWAMLTFGFVGVVFGSLSKQHRQNGGLLAEHLSAVSSLQQLVGINVSILDEQKKTRQATEGLVQLEKTGIADNPRVTLSKQGIAWSEESFMEALGSGNADDVALFLQGGMRFTFGSLGRAFIHYTPQVAEVIRAHADAVSADACMFGGNESRAPLGLRGIPAWLYNKDWKLDEDRLRLFAAVCNKPEVRQELENLEKEPGPYAGLFRRVRASL